jgi:hypothetical protein
MGRSAILLQSNRKKVTKNGKRMKKQRKSKTPMPWRADGKVNLSMNTGLRKYQAATQKNTRK